METIKNYLETMFANMPNTEAVRKAKTELLQMMEDKYTELIADGVSENEAVGTVITEFGNLDELAGDLGLEKEVEEEKEYKKQVNRRPVTLDEVKGYLDGERFCGFRIALGVALCIVAANGPVLFEDMLHMNENYGVVFLFACIAAAIVLFVYTGINGNKNAYVVNEPCQIDMMTNNYVVDERNRYKTTHATRLTIGILMLVCCWTPCAILDERGEFLEHAGAFILLILVAIGVFLIVETSTINGSFDKVLKINDEQTVSGNYDGKVKYINKTVENIMSVYWPTVTCIYFIWSFLTFNWGRSWIIWPIAAIIRKIIVINMTENE